MFAWERPLDRVIVQSGRVVRIEEWRLGEWSFWRWLLGCGGREAFQSRLMVEGPDHRECSVSDGAGIREVWSREPKDTMDVVIRDVCGRDAEGYVKVFQMENPDAVALCQMFPHHDVVFQA